MTVEQIALLLLGLLSAGLGGFLWLVYRQVRGLDHRLDELSKAGSDDRVEKGEGLEARLVAAVDAAITRGLRFQGVASGSPPSREDDPSTGPAPLLLEPGVGPALFQPPLVADLESSVEPPQEPDWARPDPAHQRRVLFEQCLRSKEFLEEVWPRLTEDFETSQAHASRFLWSHGLDGVEIEPYPDLPLGNPRHWRFMILHLSDQPAGRRALVPRYFLRFDEGYQGHLFEHRGAEDELERFMADLQQVAWFDPARRYGKDVPPAAVTPGLVRLAGRRGHEA